MGAVTARGLGGVLLALVLGASLGVGAAYAMRPEPDASGTPVPVPAASPSVPTDQPYAPDIDYPSLGEVEAFDRYRIGNALETWDYAVPEGWVAYAVPGERPTRPRDVAELDEVRFRPEGEPLEGGYSLRVKAVDNHKTPTDEVIDRVAGLERAYDDIDIFERTSEALYFTFRDNNGRLRYNFFRWFTAPGAAEATLEMSIAGRAADEAGMRGLFDRFALEAEPVDD